MGESGKSPLGGPVANFLFFHHSVSAAAVAPEYVATKPVCLFLLCCLSLLSISCHRTDYLWVDTGLRVFRLHANTTTL